MFTDFVFEWIISPKNFCQDLTKIRLKKYLAHIEQNIIRVIIPSKLVLEVSPHDIQDNLTRELNKSLLSQQVIKGIAFSLKKNGVYKQDENGQKVEIPLVAFSVALPITDPFSYLEIIHKDKNGYVIQDTRKQKEEYRKFVRKTIQDNYEIDPSLRSILRSYNQSLQDPLNSLIYLYEVKETLEIRLGGNEKKSEKEMIDKLSKFKLFELGGECLFSPSENQDLCLRKINRICSEKYCVSTLTTKMVKDLKKIANDKELRQGRHRGQALNPLRDATKDEMLKAVKATRCLIEAYLRLLAQQKLES